MNADLAELIGWQAGLDHIQTELEDMREGSDNEALCKALDRAIRCVGIAVGAVEDAAIVVNEGAW